ncbi:hypothetical protein Vretimale_4892 [Volvox reticuliferus]|uniref:Thymidylate kinase n=1 Tax=Volvox reticuliferus TaxID=1737510 RepID=A0A8J4DHU8_9CHLO|nr:hypothetical protein Vretifemale_3522 [Volvox reticuliferus]GIL99768.1 hypothetical protein Vretimale_4892 [Volvox reticuliferus]
MTAFGAVRVWPRFPRASVVKCLARSILSVHCKCVATAPCAPRGALIVFEGIDRCGKSTQSNMLVNTLRSRRVNVEHWRFPDRSTKIGQKIDDYLHNGVQQDDTAVHLLFTANRFEKRNEMLRLLAGGTTLVLDRYSYSGVAYTAAKGVPHLDSEYCRSVEVGLPAADLVVFMAMPPEQAAARGGFGAERYEKLDFQRKVAQQYEALKDSHWLTLDATLQPELIHQQVMGAALPMVENAARGAPLGRLWDYRPLELPASAEVAQPSAVAESA